MKARLSVFLLSLLILSSAGYSDHEDKTSARAAAPSIKLGTGEVCLKTFSLQKHGGEYSAVYTAFFSSTDKKFKDTLREIAEVPVSFKLLVTFEENGIQKVRGWSLQLPNGGGCVNCSFSGLEDTLAKRKARANLAHQRMAKLRAEIEAGYGYCSAPASTPNVQEAELDTPSEHEVSAALKFVGQLSDGDVENINSQSSFFPYGLIAMIDPLVHRQGSKEPMTSALPGPGFSSLKELFDIVKRNPNADILPKMSTENWSDALSLVLKPVIEKEKIGSKNGQAIELTATQVFEMLSLSRISNVPPTPGEDTSNRVKISQANWQELRTHIGELAIAYQNKIQASAK